MRRRAFALPLLVGMGLFASPIVRAQDQDNPPGFDRAPAHIEFVDGLATIEREGRVESAVSTAPLVAGDRIRTDSGRVEILLGDNSALYLDQQSTLDLQSDSLLRLLDGRLTLVVSAGLSTPESPRYQIDTPVASVRIDGAGEYQIANLTGTGWPETRLSVIRGAAQLVTDRGAMNVRAGEVSSARENGAPGYPQVFNSARWDDFDRWTYERQHLRLGAISNQYLPSGVQGYAGTFDRYGSWGQDPGYGYVWYPTVAGDWRPYSDGYWNYVGIYGWNWIGFDQWTWPTHHFGRWGFHHSRWFWIPSSRWGPAWVHWATAPGFVSWCPLGFDNRPVFGFSDRNRFPGGSWPDPWRGWTVVRRQSFGQSTRITTHAIDGRTLADNARAPFILQRQPPPPHIAVPRGSVSARVASAGAGRAVPRAVIPPPASASVGRGAFTRSPDARIPVNRIGGEPRVLNPRRGTLSVLGTGSRGIGPTRIDSPPPAYGYGIGPTYRPAEAVAPYDRASRVAAERSPGIGRQPLRPGYSGVSTTPSAYPLQFRSTIPEPFRYVPGAGSSNGGIPWGIYEHRGSIPQSAAPMSGRPPMIAPPPNATPMPGRGSYAPGMVAPSRSGPRTSSPAPAPQRPGIPTPQAARGTAVQRGGGRQ